MEPSGMRIPGDASSQYEYMSPIGYSNSSRCGYCGTRAKSQSKRFSYYARVSSLSPGFYQSLLDKCWRRSGTLMYRPDQRRSCCPHYTIRLDSSKFKPSRAQRQTINRFNKYVIGDSYAKGVARLRPLSRDQAKKRDNHFDLVERIHEAEDAKLLKPLEAAHKLEVTLEHDDFTEEKFSVYENYQRVVHKDKPSEITRNGFKGFLCDSPLRRETIIGSNGCERRLGSYHQCYRLDGKLVAIGVLDLLPECVSSVYFLYDESIHKHAPGKIGALYEIALAIEKGYGWWYPGFYIHSCPKMRYKIDYSPQFVLDPVALSWDPLDREVLDLLDKKAFVSMLEERQAKSASVLHSSKDAISGAETSDGPGRSASLTNMPDEDNKDGMDDMGDEEDEDDEDNIWLFNSKMPGITPFSTIVALDMDHIRVKIAPKGPLYQTSDLVIWEEQDVEQWPGLKASVAELVATIGPDLMDQICLDFIPHRR